MSKHGTESTQTLCLALRRRRSRLPDGDRDGGHDLAAQCASLRHARRGAQHHRARQSMLAQVAPQSETKTITARDAALAMVEQNPYAARASQKYNSVPAAAQGAPDGAL